jgi:hypothetical protein
MATAFDDKKKNGGILSDEVRAILAVCDDAVAEANSLADLIGKVVANGLTKLIKG